MKTELTDSRWLAATAAAVAVFFCFAGGYLLSVGCGDDDSSSAACDDGTMNGDETDVDCGGSCPDGCANGQGCLVPADCESGNCQGGTCRPPAAHCNDNVQNGDETDVDCGGTCPNACADGEGCLIPADCESGVCTGDICQTPTCSDGVRNGNETGVDCGGSCAACPDVVNGTLQISGDFPTTERGRALYLWVETLGGQYVDTIEQYMGRSDAPLMWYTAMNCRFINDLCDNWQQAAGEWPPPTCDASHIPINPTPIVLDGVMQPSVLQYGSGHYDGIEWDCLDHNDNPIPRATYRVFIEISRDDVGHPVLPRYYDQVDIDLSGGSTSVNFPNVSTDPTVGTLTLIFTAN